MIRLRQLLCDCLHPRRTLLAHRRRDLIRAPCRRRPTPRRVGEDVHPRKAHLTHKGEPRREVLLRLSRKADDDVRRDRHAWHSAAHIREELRERRRIVVAVHRAQDVVAPRLQGQMQMRSKARLRPHEREEILRQLHRLQRAQPQPPQSLCAQCGAARIGKRRTLRKVDAVSAEVNPRQHHLAKPRRREFLHLARHRRERTRLHRPACIGDNAERAEILATILDLEKGTRAVRHAVQGDVLKGTRLHHIRDLLHHTVRAKRLLHIVHDARALLRPDHDAHAFERTHLGGRDLRIAARHSDARRRIGARRTADDLAGLAVAQMRHRARIDDIDVRPLLERHDLIAARTEQPLHRLRLELIHLTAERHKCCLQLMPSSPPKFIRSV